ncbi:MAG: HAD family hydrolase [Candidatus Thorarchaeota archaeon]
MKLKGIIFDFGFTLFTFQNPSVDKYYDCFSKGLLKSIESLKNKTIIFDQDEIREEFVKLFNKKKSTYFRQSIKTKDEFPTSKIFKEVIQTLIDKDIIIENAIIREDFLEELSELYHSCEEEEWKPYKETRMILETLSSYHSLRLGLISNHPNHKTVKNMLKNNDMKKFFHAIVTSAKFGKRKPNSEIFYYTLKKMGLNEHDAKDCLMIGDEAADAVGAYKVGMQVILKEREYEFPFETKIEIPNLIKIKTLKEVLNHISLS